MQSDLFRPGWSTASRRIGVFLAVTTLLSIFTSPQKLLAQQPQAQNNSDKVAMKPFSNSAHRRDAVTKLKEKEKKRKEEAVAIATKRGFKIRGEERGRQFELFDVDDEGKPVYRITFNREAAISTGASQIRNTGIYDLNGDGWYVGIWDGGSVRTTHQEFSGRVSSMDGASVSSHATHVGGTIGADGDSTAAQGMAPLVQIDSYDWNSDLSEMASRAAASSSISGDLVLSNHSYGYITGWDGTRYYGRYPEREDQRFGSYDSYSEELDDLCFNAPYYLPFIAAGNDRIDTAPDDGDTFEYYSSGSWVTKTYDSSTDPYDDAWDDGGFDTIEGYGISKNVVTIGAVDDAVSGSVREPSNGTMTSFSSWGPADDGRVKPDLVANGVSLYSSDSGSDSQYSYKSGTSMATPNAMGTAVLLHELYSREFPGEVMRASTLKALLIHTADDLGNTGPDYTFGWGLINAKDAADTILAHEAVPSANTIVEGVLDTDNPEDVYAFSWDGSSPIRVTLCWTDPAGTSVSGLDNRTAVLVNDLDIAIEKDSTTFSPYILDVENPADPATTGDNTLDNVEQIDIASPSSGTYTLTVSHKSTLSGSSQNYSLIITGQAPNEGGPIIGVSPTLLTTSVTQGSDAAETSFLVTNAGADTLDYTISEDIDWLTVSPASGSSTGEGDTIGLSFDTSGLAIGVYTGEIVVSSSGLPSKTVTVELSVTASSVTLEEGVDQDSSTLTDAGDASWFGQVVNTHDGQDVGRSGVIGDNETTGFSVDVTGPGVLTFWWRTDSEADSDKAIFSVGGVETVTLSGDTDWERQTIDIGAGTQTLLWSYAKNASGSSGEDAAWVDEIEFIPTYPQISRSPVQIYSSVEVGNDADSQTFTVWNSGSSTLNYSISSDSSWMSVTPNSGTAEEETDTITVNFDTDALTPGVYNGTLTIEGGEDVTPEVITVQLTVTGGGPSIGESVDYNTTWTLGGNAEWFGQESETYDGVDAAQAGSIEDDEESTFETTIEGPGTLSFWWKVDSETNYDFLHFDFDGSSVISTSGSRDWEQIIANVSATGTHTLRWRYAKDEIISRGADTAWVDEVVWTPGTAAMSLSDTGFSHTISQGDSLATDTFTVTNSGDGGVLHYSISDNASWLSVTPDSGESAGEADTISIEYDTDSLQAGSYTGTITVSATNLGSQTITVDLTVEEVPAIPVSPEKGSPYLQQFDGTIGTGATDGWSYLSTNTGRIQIVDEALRMDDSVDRGRYSYNHAILHANLAGKSGVVLDFSYRNLGDEVHTLPTSYSGSVTGDGVSISADGTNWIRIHTLGSTSGFADATIDLSAVVQEAGLSFTSDFQIKFQQYDDWSASSDGYEFDDIAITVNGLMSPDTLTVSYLLYGDRISLTWSEIADASRYNLYRSTADDFATATLLATVTDAEFEDDTADPGTSYYYWVESENDDETAAVEIAGTIGAVAVVRPDLVVGATTGQTKGDGVYNSSGSGQKITERTRKRKAVNSYSQWQNDSEVEDLVSVSGSGGNRKFKVKYIRLSPSGANITAAVRTGRYQSSALSPGENERVKVQVKATSALGTRKGKYKLRLRGRSSLDTGQDDCVQVITVRVRE